MINIFTVILKEPLFHFLFLGLVLYAYYGTKASVPLQDSSKIIYFEKDLKSSDVSNTLQLYDEILLQEAYNLDLQKKDKLVSKRLISQMEHILYASKNSEEPSEENLYKFYKEHSVDYAEILSVNFRYLPFDPLKDKELLRYMQLFHTLPKSIIADTKYTTQQDKKMIQARFGKYFSREIFNLPLATWSAPIYASDGYYLVYIDKKDTASTYAFDTVEDRVYKDYKNNKQKTIRDKAYKNLRENYTIVTQ